MKTKPSKSTKAPKNSRKPSPSKPSKKIEPQISAKCIMGHYFTLTRQQVKEAQDFGCAMCPDCGCPATVQNVVVNFKRN